MRAVLGVPELLPGEAGSCFGGKARVAGSQDASCKACVQASLANTLLFNNLDAATQKLVVSEMYERDVLAGEILIKEGDTGVAASEMYVVKTGAFEVTTILLPLSSSKHVQNMKHGICKQFASWSSF